MTRVYRKSMREALEEMRANQLGAIQEAEENPLVKKKPDGTYCVYRSDGSIAKEFDNKEDANDYARNNHDDLILDEARRQSGNYDLYHKDFSSAMQHAYKMAKKLHGITISPDEISDKVATGPKKPSEGKTNKYRLEGDKGGIQIQVYNKGGSKPFELNMYKEEVDLDEQETGPTMDPIAKAQDKVKKAEKATKVADLQMKVVRAKAEEVELDEQEFDELDQIMLDEGIWDNIKAMVGIGPPTAGTEAAKKIVDKAKESNKEKRFAKQKQRTPGQALQHIFKRVPKKEEVELDEGRIKDRLIKTSDLIQKLIKPGDPDRFDFVGVRDHIESNHMKIVKQIVMKMDTEPRERVISALVDGLGKKETEKILGVRIREEVEVDEQGLAPMKIPSSMRAKKSGLAPMKIESTELDEMAPIIPVVARLLGQKVMKNVVQKTAMPIITSVGKAAGAFVGGAAAKDMDQSKKHPKPTGPEEEKRNKEREAENEKRQKEIEQQHAANAMQTQTEASAYSDARRAMAADPSTKQRFSKNISASDEDIKSADKNIIMQLRKVVSLKGVGTVTLTPQQKSRLKKKDSRYLKTAGSGFIEFENGKSEKIDLKMAQAILDKYNRLRKPIEKEQFQAKISKSKRDMLKALKEDIQIEKKQDSLREVKNLMKENRER